MLQSRSLLFDSLWLLLAAARLRDPALRLRAVAAAATNALRSWSDAQGAKWLDRTVSLSLFAGMAQRAETEIQKLALVFTVVSFAAMMFRDGERVLHHMFHYSGFVALSLLAGKPVRWIALDTALYWLGVFARSSGTAVAAAVLVR